MVYKYFSQSGQILPFSKAHIPLSSIEYSYGFGVYELLKVRNTIAYFESQHIDRLLQSAKILGLEHGFTKAQISKYIFNLLTAEKIESGNLKIILLGGKINEDAKLFILPLSPLYPEREYYKKGVKTITFAFERLFPQAKTLNMLGSYLAYKKAKEQNCYDALLLDRAGNITEGTRTNFFVIKDKTIFTQTDKKILKGVSRMIVLYLAKRSGYKVTETNTKFGDLARFDAAFLTSTSSNIMPIKQIDDFIFPTIPDALKVLMQKYNNFLKESKGVFIPD